MRVMVGHAGYTAEAVALFARCSVQPTLSRKRLIDTTIRILKAQGVWSNLSALYFTAAADNQVAKLNWINGAFNLTAVNSPTFTADRGFKGDGSTSYLDTGYTGTGMSASSAAGAAWLNVEGGDGDSAIAYVNFGVRITAYSGGNLGGTIGSVSNSVAVANGLGFSGVTGNGTTMTLQKGAAQTGFAYTPGSFSTAANYGLLGNGINQFSAARIAAAAIGTALTTGQLSALQSAMNGYLTAVGGA